MKAGTVVAALGVALSLPAASSVGRAGAPQWLIRSERTVLMRVFEGAKPTRIHYVDYPKKIAVVFEFDHVVVCGACSAPSAGDQPRGRAVRVSFDRWTHQLAGASGGWAMRFCEVLNGRPPLSECLAR